MVSATFERLPENVLPKEYNITIKPNLNTFKFNGQVKIECLVTEATSEISFNVADMEISNYMYVAEIAAENVLMLSKDEKATAKFSSPLPLGKGYLSMDFIGSLNDQMKGLYRSKYVINGEERYAAVSQFEPTDARRAFPCWDEPAIKAVFNITLIVPKDRVALSNMVSKYYRNSCNWVVAIDILQNQFQLKLFTNVKFAPSPIMSTYLVAIVVGEYDYIEDTSEDGVLVRVYTPVVKQNKADFLFSLKNSHPIEVPVGSPSEIDEIFDTISYNKGASVIRMLHNFIGDKVSSVQLILFIVASFLVKKVNAALKRQIWMTESSSSRIISHSNILSPVDEISTSKNYYWQDNSKSFCFNSRPSTLCLINTTRNFFTNLLSCSEVHWPNIRSIT
ncbi:Puromycin-sensitive aminopeptidase [Nymphon striatum]|nr:Puromycin-sensitive aminopeptidase [Nymphon striatum]